MALHVLAVTSLMGLDMLVDRSAYVTVDGVMGGQSNAEGTMNADTMVFEGRVNTDGGGFAYMTMYGTTMNLAEGASGSAAERHRTEICTHG